MNRIVRAAGACTPLLLLALSACGDTKTDSVQVGYRGVALEQNYDRGDLAKRFASTLAGRPVSHALLRAVQRLPRAQLARGLISDCV